MIMTIETLTAQFWLFAQQLEVDEEEPLDEYLLKWLETGEPIITSGGDYGVFMFGVVCIIDDWLKEPSALDFSRAGQPTIKRRPGRIFSEGSKGWSSPVFDPAFFRPILLGRLFDHDLPS